ncbi:hypothetical protein [Sporofaciens musculi]|nr:hypothetical protein [Sporofaciens musculi]
MFQKPIRDNPVNAPDFDVSDISLMEIPIDSGNIHLKFQTGFLWGVE